MPPYASRPGTNTDGLLYGSASIMRFYRNKCREKADRSQPCSACTPFDSQSVKSAVSGGSQQWSATKLIKGKVSAACSGRYARLAGVQSSAPPPTFKDRDAINWSRAAGNNAVRSVSLSREIVRRQRLSGAWSISPRPGRHPARSETARLRQAIRWRVPRAVVQPRRWVVERTIRLNRPLPPTGHRTGRTSTATRSPSSSSRPFDSLLRKLVILHKVSGRTLNITAPSQHTRRRNVAETQANNTPATNKPQLKSGVCHRRLQIPRLLAQLMGE